MSTESCITDRQWGSRSSSSESYHDNERVMKRKVCTPNKPVSALENDACTPSGSDPRKRICVSDPSGPPTAPLSTLVDDTPRPEDDNTTVFDSSLDESESDSDSDERCPLCGKVLEGENDAVVALHLRSCSFLFNGGEPSSSLPKQSSRGLKETNRCPKEDKVLSIPGKEERGPQSRNLFLEALFDISSSDEEEQEEKEVAETEQRKVAHPTEPTSTDVVTVSEDESKERQETWEEYYRSLDSSALDDLHAEAYSCAFCSRDISSLSFPSRISHLKRCYVRRDTFSSGASKPIGANGSILTMPLGKATVRTKGPQQGKF